MDRRALEVAAEGCRAKVIHLLAANKLPPPERVQVLCSWKNSGSNLHAGEQIPPEAKAGLKDLAQYILRNPLSVEKMTLGPPGDFVFYRSRLNAKINRSLQVFDRLPGGHHPAYPRPNGQTTRPLTRRTALW